MMAKTRGPLSVKNHSFAVYAPSLRGGTIGPGKSRALLITPPPGAVRLFLLVFDQPNFAQTEFSEARRMGEEIHRGFIACCSNENAAKRSGGVSA